MSGATRPHVDAWEMHAGQAYAAIGACSLAAYPVGFLLLKVKCGWSLYDCFPTVSDVERPVLAGNDVWAVDVVRRALLTCAVLLRTALIPALLIQAFPLLRPRSLRRRTVVFLRVAFYMSLIAWVASDIFQVTAGNDVQHRDSYTPHTIAAHLDVAALIVCNIALLAILADDTESTKAWLATGTLSLLKVSGAGLFLAAKLSTHSIVWQAVEWGMLVAMGVLQVSVGLAMPPSLKLDVQRLRVHRTEKSDVLVGSGWAPLARAWGTIASPQQAKGMFMA